MKAILLLVLGSGVCAAFGLAYVASGQAVLGAGYMLIALLGLVSAWRLRFGQEKGVVVLPVSVTTFRTLAALSGVAAMLFLGVMVVSLVGLSPGGLASTLLWLVLGVLACLFAWRFAAVARLLATVVPAALENEQHKLVTGGRRKGLPGLLQPPYVIAATTERLLIFQARLRGSAPMWEVSYACVEATGIEAGRQQELVLRLNGETLALTGMPPDDLAQVLAHATRTD